MATAFAPGAKVAEVARDADICTSLLYRWRQAHLAAQRGPVVGFAPPVLIKESTLSLAGAAPSEPAITVDLPGGVRVKFGATAPAALVTATLGALR